MVIVIQFFKLIKFNQIITFLNMKTNFRIINPILSIVYNILWTIRKLNLNILTELAYILWRMRFQLVVFLGLIQSKRPVGTSLADGTENFDDLS